jgi:hypothetical protein
VIVGVIVDVGVIVGVIVDVGVIVGVILGVTLLVGVMLGVTLLVGVIVGVTLNVGVGVGKSLIDDSIKYSKLYEFGAVVAVITISIVLPVTDEEVTPVINVSIIPALLSVASVV